MDIEELKSLMKCMMIVSYIDGFDSKEFDLINEVFQEVWTDRPQELEELVELMINDVAGYNSEGLMESQFEESTQALAMTLDQDNKTRAQMMMMKLIKADGKITGEETQYYIKFKELLA